MAKARKEKRPKRNRGNFIKMLKRIQQNEEVLKKLTSQK